MRKPFISISNQFLIKFSIGNWDGNGHGKCEHFIAESNLPVEELRELHFKCKDVFGFTPGELCSDYKTKLLTDDQAKKLKEFHVYDGSPQIEGAFEVLKIWILMLKAVDTRFTGMVRKDDAKTMHFVGFDDKGRHLETPGYGLWE